MSCRACGAGAVRFGGARLLDRHDVAYFRCTACGFVQTEEPYWLAEAYADAITALDTGLVSRNIVCAKVALAVITTWFDRRGRFLDYGAGYGLLVRMMRDSGLDFHHFDEHCPNLLARGYSAGLGAGERYELITAFEVVEHLPHPLEHFERLLAHTGSLLFTTVLLPPDAPQPGRWWYYGLEHGQHVSIYTRPALQAIADRFGRRLYSHGIFHLVTDRPLSPLLFRLLTNRGLAMLLSPMFSPQSLRHGLFP